jgi:hypothetical protein
MGVAVGVSARSVDHVGSVESVHKALLVRHHSSSSSAAGASRCATASALALGAVVVEAVDSEKEDDNNVLSFADLLEIEKFQVSHRTWRQYNSSTPLFLLSYVESSESAPHQVRAL